MFRVIHSTSVVDLRSVFLTTAFGFALSPLAIAETGDSEVGQRTYEESCEHCHGYAGNGQGQMAEYLTPPPAKLTSESTQSKTDAQLQEIILKGRPGRRWLVSKAR